MSDVLEMAQNSDEVRDVNIPDVMALTARLAQLLAKEADYLEEMKVSKIGDLQEEKRQLIQALEAMKKRIAQRPEILQEISEEERDDLRQVVAVFNEILEENYKRLSMARAVNQELVSAITEAVQEASRQEQYDQKGVNHKPKVDSVSVTLDERA